MSDNEERQESELLALNAIYPELNDLRNERKIIHRKNRQQQSTWRPLELQITLKPNSDEDVFVQCDLFIKCNLKYPQQSPDLIIKNVVGLSKSDYSTIKG